MRGGIYSVGDSKSKILALIGGVGGGGLIGGEWGGFDMNSTVVWYYFPPSRKEVKPLT